jgi:hypothetical protein
MEEPATANRYQIGHVQLLLASFHRFVGRPLMRGAPGDISVARQVFFAPFVMLSHDTSADPILNYGNKLALQLWETDWYDLTRMPSRLTAEPVHRDQRARFLQQTEARGYVDDYAGIRITTSGKRFRMEGAIIWNLIDAEGRRAGQAAMFEKYHFL